MRTTPDRRPLSGVALREANRRFYDTLWSDARLVAPERFNSWPLVADLAARATRRLEIAPGLRPRLPIAGTSFVDLSLPPLRHLRAAGGHVACGLVTDLPMATGAFDLICALDIVEHVDDDAAAFAELSRVAAPGAALLLSVPLHPEAWTPFDDMVGHHRRYEPVRLLQQLAGARLEVRQSAIFGMQPRNPRLVGFGMRYLERHRSRAMWWYNRIFMPLGLCLAKPLHLVDGLVELPGVDTVLLVCRRMDRDGESAPAIST
ncbi:class I SAM-dependent methyltransferase [Lichenicoccus sp.]|uniref:class I SAM-dependent methyltransferase n=1 Tax=Lichenicoccus sp. TaxID=2781899 RepID=UPI003D0F44A9